MTEVSPLFVNALACVSANMRKERIPEAKIARLLAPLRSCLVGVSLLGPEALGQRRAAVETSPEEAMVARVRMAVLTAMWYGPYTDTGVVVTVPFRDAADCGVGRACFQESLFAPLRQEILDLGWGCVMAFTPKIELPSFMDEQETMTLMQGDLCVTLTLPHAAV